MEPAKADGGSCVGTGEVDRSECAIVASVEQLFTGLCVGQSSLKLRCSECGTQLSEGERVSVDAFRPVETTYWQFSRYQCPDCAPESITTPTLGVTEIRISARLAVMSDVGSQQHRPCLTEPAVVAAAPPADGTVP